MSASMTKVLERANNMDKRLRRAAQEAQLNKQRAIGAGISVLAAGVMGYVDGAYDYSEHDQTEGDGFRVGGIPVTPVAGLIAVGIGLSDAVPGAEYIAHAGIGLACGWGYGEGRKRGAASKTAEERKGKWG